MIGSQPFSFCLSVFPLLYHSVRSSWNIIWQSFFSFDNHSRHSAAIKTLCFRVTQDDWHLYGHWHNSTLIHIIQLSFKTLFQSGSGWLAPPPEYPWTKRPLKETTHILCSHCFDFGRFWQFLIMWFDPLDLSWEEKNWIWFIHISPERDCTGMAIFFR